MPTCYNFCNQKPQYRSQLGDKVEIVTNRKVPIAKFTQIIGRKYISEFPETICQSALGSTLTWILQSPCLNKPLRQILSSSASVLDSRSIHLNIQNHFQLLDFRMFLHFETCNYLTIQGKLFMRFVPCLNVQESPWLANNIFWGLWQKVYFPVCVSVCGHVTVVITLRPDCAPGFE